MNAEYADGTPVFSPCSKCAIRLLQCLTILGTCVALVSHVMSYFGTHTLAGGVAKIVTSLSDSIVKGQVVEDFV